MQYAVRSAFLATAICFLFTLQTVLWRRSWAWNVIIAYYTTMRHEKASFYFYDIFWQNSQCVFGKLVFNNFLVLLSEMNWESSWSEIFHLASDWSSAALSCEIWRYSSTSRKFRTKWPYLLNQTRCIAAFWRYETYVPAKMHWDNLLVDWHWWPNGQFSSFGSWTNTPLLKFTASPVIKCYRSYMQRMFKCKWGDDC